VIDDENLHGLLVFSNFSQGCSRNACAKLEPSKLASGSPFGPVRPEGSGTKVNVKS